MFGFRIVCFFLMVGTIAISKAQPFENRTIWNQTFKKSDFRSPYYNTEPFQIWLSKPSEFKCIENLTFLYLGHNCKIVLLLQLSFETEIGIIRQFQFTSERQCMSVVVRGVGESHFTVFCKGSPEKIKSISLPETLPADFETTLDRYYFLTFRYSGISPHNQNAVKNVWHSGDLHSRLVFKWLKVV